MQTKRKNISPSRVDDRRMYFLRVRLVAAASSAHPMKYGQNQRAGMQDGTMCATNSGPRKCSGAKMASGTAMKTQAKSDELVPAAGRDELFAKDEDSDDKIDKPGKRHPEICRGKHPTPFFVFAKVRRQGLYPG